MIGSIKISCRFLHTTGICLRTIVKRRPVRVHNVPSTEYVPQVPALDPSFNIIKSSQTAKATEPHAIIEKPENNIVSYEKLKINDGRLTKVLTLLKSRKQREKTGKILLEGKRLINDAIDAGMQLKTLYFSREKDLQDIRLKDPENVEVLKVLYQTLKVWSGLNTCPGVMAVFKRPSAEEINVLSQPTIPVTILCDNIREPGNLGSIIRNAAAAGCENILLMKGCVDPWEVKVLRAGCGGHFRVPIVNDIDWSLISNYIPSSATILIADNAPFVEEAHFTSEYINFDEINNEENLEEESKYVTRNEFDQPLQIDESFNSKVEIEKFRDVPLPCHLYTHVKYPKNNIVLYVGGETHGVDSRIVKLACEYGGKKIKIPMENDTNSLNSAFAMTIILFEIKRHFSQTYIAK